MSSSYPSRYCLNKYFCTGKHYHISYISRNKIIGIRKLCYAIQEFELNM